MPPIAFAGRRQNWAMDETRRPNVWQGDSGELFAEMVREQLDKEGRTADVEVNPVSPTVAPPGAYLVSVEVHDGPDLFFEVADWVDGARVMDPHGEDLSRAEALRYLQLRCGGKSPVEALGEC